jgi:hypothetical protein
MQQPQFTVAGMEKAAYKWLHKEQIFLGMVS